MKEELSQPPGIDGTGYKKDREKAKKNHHQKQTLEEFQVWIV